jgi:hypothetical protein
MSEEVATIEADQPKQSFPQMAVTVSYVLQM